MYLLSSWLYGQLLLILLHNAHSTQASVFMSGLDSKYQLCSGETCGTECSIGKVSLSEPMLVVDPTAIGILSDSLETKATVGNRKRTLVSGAESERNQLLERRSPEKPDPDITVPRAPSSAEHVMKLVRAIDSTNRWQAVKESPVVSGEFYPYPEVETPSDTSSTALAGIRGFMGCTAFIIFSKKGVFLGHIWEVPGFVVPTDDERRPRPVTDSEFEEAVYKAFVNGNEVLPSLSSLIGDDKEPGPLHRQYKPRIQLIGPETRVWEREQRNINTKLRHDKRMNELNSWLQKQVPGSYAMRRPWAYLRRAFDNAERMEAALKQFGVEWFAKCIVEVTSEKFDFDGQQLLERNIKIWFSADLVHEQPFVDPLDDEEC